MSQVFPTDPKERKALWDRVQYQSPELAAAIADYREKFQGVRLEYVWLEETAELPEVAFGSLPKGVTPHIDVSVSLTVQQKENARKAKLANAARKRKK